MIGLGINLDPQQLEGLRRRLDEKKLARAARKAGNDAIADVMRAAVAYVRTTKRIKESTIERRLSVVIPGSRATLEGMSWGLRVSNKPISIGSYPSEQTPQGVVAEVNVGTKFVLRHAFIRTVRNGFRGVFQRQGPGAARYPLKSLVASGVADVLRDPQASDRLSSVGRTAMARAFDKYVQQELGQGG